MRDIKKFQRVVWTYYREHGRHTLPWRNLPALAGTRDPYAILVSEIMLQQTQVERVIPYFNRWMKKFPTPEVLARAKLIDVFREWSGLGYNRRAKYLRDAAKQMRLFRTYRAKIVMSYDELRQLPGVGDYTAKAVRVFAFNEPEVLIETNVRSAVIHHFFPPTRSTIKSNGRRTLSYVHDRDVLKIIEHLVKGQDQRTFYAALMDYGAYLKRTHLNPSRKSVHYKKQQQFKGSLREARGAVLRASVHGDLSLSRISTEESVSIEMLKKARSNLKRERLLPSP